MRTRSPLALPDGKTRRNAGRNPGNQPHARQHLHSVGIIGPGRRPGPISFRISALYRRPPSVPRDSQPRRVSLLRPLQLPYRFGAGVARHVNGGAGDTPNP